MFYVGVFFLILQIGGFSVWSLYVNSRISSICYSEVTSRGLGLSIQFVAL